MDNTNPPFYIGQKVVATETRKSDRGLFRITKGQQFNVAGLVQCVCGSWKVDVGMRVEIIGDAGCKCGKWFAKNSHVVYVNSRYLAPIDELYEDQTASIAASSKETKEVPDKIFIPETVND